MADQPAREIIAFMSKDWDGQVKDGEIIDDGTRGFCIVRDGTYVIHDGAALDFMWVDYDEADPVRLSILDRHMVMN